MLATALAVLVLVGAPDDDATKKKLRIAWASQYEWREDKLQNVTLDFEWKRTFRTRKDEETVTSGSGQLLIVGDEVKRRHLEGARGGGRAEVLEGASWVLRRFVRKPFEEAFKDMKLKALEPSASGADRIQAGGRVFVLKNDRIIAIERPMPPRKGRIRVDYKLDDLGDGYAVLREHYVERGDKGRKLATTRTLTARKGSDVPMPGSYHLGQEFAGGFLTVEITFKEPKVDLKDPVTIDPGARDLLKEAWLQRYVLPAAIRVRADFTRRPGKLLAQASWNQVTGEFELWEGDKLEVVLTDKSIRSRSRRENITKTCTRHLSYLFGLMRDIPFEEEFKDCGFTQQAGGDGTVVKVYGYANAVSLLIRDDAIAGYLEHGALPEDWTMFKLRKSKDGLQRIEKISRTYEGNKKTGKITYHRVKGVAVPKKFQMVVVPSSSRWDRFDLCEYALKRIKIELPK